MDDEVQKERIKQFFISLLKTVLIVGISACVAFVLRNIGVMEENILMVFLTGVLLVVVETRKYLWGIIASIFSVGIFNFFFTAPFFTFHINNPNYIISILIFLVVSVIAGMLTTKLQHQAFIAKYNERQTEFLYKVSSGFVHVSGLINSIKHSLHSIFQFSRINCVFYSGTDFSGLQEPVYIEDDFDDIEIIEDGMAAAWCLSSNTPAGYGTEHFTNSIWKYIPVKSSSKMLGVMGIYFGQPNIAENAMLFITTVISQMALVIEREQLNVQQEESRIEIEKEKLRSNLLRSISHDLRTPLTGIAGASGFMMESFDNLDKETIINLLTDIEKDARWLNMMVENLLNMTRIQEGKLIITKQKEVVDDIVAEAVLRAVKKNTKHPVSILVPDEVVLVPMDAKLIIQVLVNLLDNAVKHTEENTPIKITAHQEKNSVVFEVADSGTGIKSELLDKVFESFVSEKTRMGDSCRGMGLGLTICKAIVEAHNGAISACNGENGGAVFTFSLPLEN